MNHPANTPTEREVPGPSKLKSLSYFGQLKKVGFLNVMLNLHRDYGDWVKLSAPTGDKVYFVSAPEDIQNILQTQSQKFIKGRSLELFKLLIGNGLPVSDGETWRNQRRVLQPLFHRQTLINYVPLMFDTVTEHAQRWVDESQKNTNKFNVNQVIARMTHDIVARSLLGVDINVALQDLHGHWSEALDFIVDRSYQMVRLPLSLPTPRNRRFHKAMETVHQSVEKVIQTRLKEKSHLKRDDLLSRLIKSRELESDVEILSDLGIRDQILAFLFAGHDTTANNIAWTLYLILKDPAVEKKVRQEIASVLGEAKFIELEKLEDLKYLRKIIYESLRLYPPAAMFVREASEDVTVAGHLLTKGSIIVISPYVLHRRVDLWPQPEKFDPERFEEIPKKLGLPKFIAFGYGARACIGEQFAIMEAQIVIAALLRRVKIKLVDSEQVKPKFHGTLSPDHLNAVVVSRS